MFKFLEHIRRVSFLGHLVTEALWLANWSRSYAPNSGIQLIREHWSHPERFFLIRLNQVLLHGNRLTWSNSSAWVFSNPHSLPGTLLDMLSPRPRSGRSFIGSSPGFWPMLFWNWHQRPADCAWHQPEWQTHLDRLLLFQIPLVIVWSSIPAFLRCIFQVHSELGTPHSPRKTPSTGWSRQG